MTGRVLSLLTRFKIFVGHNALEPYFCFWSRLYLRRWRPSIIVITGSVGKTNLLTVLSDQLGAGTAYSHRSNTKIGITLNILNLPQISQGGRWRWPLLTLVVPFKALFAKVRAERRYLVEYDVSYMADARYFKWWLRPEICLWTTVSGSHLQNFEKAARKRQSTPFDLVAGEFAKIASAASERIFALSDDELIRRSLDEAQAPVTFLKDDLVSYEVGLKGTVFKFKEAQFFFSQPLPKEMGHSLLLARGLLKHIGQKLKSDWRNWSPPPGRNTLLKGYKGCHLIDSSYNAQLESVVAILSMFKNFKTKEKWLVIGDMIEQGNLTAAAHVEATTAILDLAPQKLFLVGRRMREHAYPILKKHYPNLHWSARADAELISRLKDQLRGEEVILFKGAGLLDILVEALLENPADVVLLNNPGRLKAVLHS